MAHVRYDVIPEHATPRYPVAGWGAQHSLYYVAAAGGYTWKRADVEPRDTVEVKLYNLPLGLALTFHDEMLNTKLGQDELLYVILRGDPRVHPFKVDIGVLRMTEPLNVGVGVERPDWFTRDRPGPTVYDLLG